MKLRTLLLIVCILTITIVSHGQYTREATPVNAIRASAVVTLSGIPTDAQTFKVGGITYRFKNTLAAINDVKIGTDSGTTAANLTYAINGTGTPGTNYYTGITTNTKVLAVCGSPSINTLVTITSMVGGPQANTTSTLYGGAEALSVVETCTNISAAAFTGGVYGTAAREGAIRYDGTYLYIATGQQSNRGRTWKRVSISTY